MDTEAAEQELAGNLGSGGESANSHAPQHALFLADASRQFASSLDYEITLDWVARLAVPWLADWCAVDILDDDGGVHQRAVARVDWETERTGFELVQAQPPSPTASRAVLQVLRSGRPALHAMTLDESLPVSTHESEDLHALRVLGLASAMIVPMLAGDRLIGALTFGGARPRRLYELADLTVAEDYADRCALALNSARLYRDVRQAVELRDAFLATVSHDLRNPLATIAGQAQMLRRVSDREAGAAAARIRQGVGRIETSVARMIGMIDELLDIARLELGQQLELQRGSMDLVGLVRRKVSEYEQSTTAI